MYTKSIPVDGEVQYRNPGSRTGLSGLPHQTIAAPAINTKTSAASRRRLTLRRTAAGDGVDVGSGGVMRMREGTGLHHGRSRPAGQDSGDRNFARKNVPATGIEVGIEAGKRGRFTPASLKPPKTNFNHREHRGHRECVQILCSVLSVFSVVKIASRMRNRGRVPAPSLRGSRYRAFGKDESSRRRRKPTRLVVKLGSSVNRYAERQYLSEKPAEPPRMTPDRPVSGPVGSATDATG